MKTRSGNALAIAIFCGCFSLSAQPDLSLLKGVSDARISPDGATIAYTRTTTNYADNLVSSEVVTIASATGQVTRVFSGASPHWSPNGKSLAYLNTQATQSGLWIYDLDASGPRFLTPLSETDHWLGSGVVKNFEWSPDSNTIAFVAADEPAAAPTNDVRADSRFMYKTRTGFTDGRKTHIWIVPASGGQARILTPGQYDEHSICWAPDGHKIAFVSNHTPDPDTNYNDHIFTADVPSGAIAQITRTTGTELRPQWSPDGAWIAYLGWTRPQNTKDSAAEDAQLWVISANGGVPRKLSMSLDRRISDIAWHPNSHSVYCLAGDRGAVSVYRVSTDRGQMENVTSGNNIVRQYSLSGSGVSAPAPAAAPAPTGVTGRLRGVFSRGANSRAEPVEAGVTMAWVQTDITHPAEVWMGAADGHNARQLTHDNDPFTRAVPPQDAQTFWFESFDGTRVQGWVMKPAGFAVNGKYPTLLYVHGGPHGMFGYAYSDRFQSLAAQGYGIVFINPRGSSGYGQAFSDGSVLNWGGGDYKDLMAGLDYALAQNSWIDGDHLGVIGGSYGGFMTNWIVTQTHRFKAAISIAGVSDLISFYGTSLYPDLIEAEFNGLPWNNWDMLWQWSPLNHVKNASTPTLFIHGEVDHDVPITQAEEMYVALRKLGVPATLVRYPHEGHGVRGPRHVVDQDQRISEWLSKYLKNN